MFHIEGDVVDVDDVIAVIETDKVTVSLRVRVCSVFVLAH